MQAGGLHFSQHASLYQVSLNQVPISARVVFGFNQRKPPSRTIAITVDISKAFDTLPLPPHRDDLPQSGQQQHHSPSRKVQAGAPQGSIISPTLFNHFVSDCPNTDLDMTSYADNFTLLAFAPSIVEGEARVTQLCTILVRMTVRWADEKQLAIAPQKSSVTLLRSDTHQSRLHPQVCIGDDVAPLTRTPKILGVKLDTHFTFCCPHACDCVKQALRVLNVMRALAG